MISNDKDQRNKHIGTRWNNLRQWGAYLDSQKGVRGSISRSEIEYIFGNCLLVRGSGIWGQEIDRIEA